MPKAVLVLNGEDRPGTFQCVLRSLSRDEEGRARPADQQASLRMGWIRSVAHRGGFMLQLEAKDLRPYLSENYENWLADRLRSLGGVASEGGPPMKPHVYEAVDRNAWEEGKHAIVFRIVEEPSTDLRAMSEFLKRLASTEDIDVAQHESVLEGDQIWRYFRVYGRPGVPARRVRHSVGYHFEASFQLAAHESPDLRFGAPHPHDTVRHARGGGGTCDHRGWLFSVYAADNPGLYARLFETLREQGWQISRSCCRGIGQRATLLFAVRAQSGETEAQERARCERTRESLGAKAGIAKEALLARCVYHPLRESPFLCAPQGGNAKIAVFHFRLRDAAQTTGLLSLMDRWEAQCQGRYGSPSVFLFDGQPMPESPSTFSCRIGVMVAGSDAAKLVIAATATHIVEDPSWAGRVESFECAFDQGGSR